MSIVRGAASLKASSNHYVRPWIPRQMTGRKTRVDEKDQWYLQRNKKGEKYYLNTTTWQWQYETPDCLKTFARGKLLPIYTTCFN